MAKTYQVRVTNEFRSITTAARRVAGLTIDTTGDGYVGELTDVQLAELKADRYILLTNADGSEIVEDAKPVDLSKLNRTKLEEIAKEAGIEALDEYNSKADLIAAIEAKQSQPQE
jgi:hypothetical protein